MKPLFETPRAQLDLAGILNYLIAANPAAAIRFYDAYVAALDLIQKMPLAGGNLLLPEVADLDLRYCRPKGFKNYLIFYRVTDAAIEVVRIVYGARDLPSALRDTD
jgi:toxin ParE1/3/4